jgi:3-oxoacyl-[acyl-carrier protein] reductase
MENHMRFQNQIVIVTGSSRGIGRCISHHFAKEGAKVMLIGRHAETMRSVSDEINREGYHAQGFACDVSNMQNVQETVNKILDKYKSIDILVNNAGITKDNLLPRMSEQDWNDVVQINLGGVFHFTKAVTKPMLKAKRGKIINITSIIGMTGNAGQANYAASKAGIIGFTKSVARELASRGITANSIAPGYIETDMTTHFNKSFQEDMIKNIPLGKMGKPEDIAKTCLFLASADADYITGQTIVVDGGMAI